MDSRECLALPKKAGVAYTLQCVAITMCGLYNVWSLQCVAYTLCGLVYIALWCWATGREWV